MAPTNSTASRGPLCVSDLRTDHPLHDAFIDAAQEAGYPFNRDFNGAKQEGVGPLQLTVRGRRRCSAAVGYLSPVMRAAQPARRGPRADPSRPAWTANAPIGVALQQNGVVRQARARREVLLCGGAINSPQLLQLSGIGPGALLQSLVFQVVHDLPGVGENLQDHIGGRMIYRCISTCCDDERNLSQLAAAALCRLQWVLASKGPLMTGAGPMGLFVKTRPELDSPDVQYQFLAGSAEKTGDPMHKFPACTMVAIPCRPESRGWLRITSADPDAPPAMQPNYLSTQRDKDTIVAGLRVITPNLRDRGDAADGSPTE